MSIDVAVVGGGIMGLATALELARAGANVVVLESGEIGCATTQAGAGFLDLWATTQAGADEEVVIEQYGLDFYKQLSNAHDIGFIQAGNVWLAQTEDAWQRKLKPLLDHPATTGAQQLSAAEAAALVAVLRPDGIRSAIYQPGGARITTQAAARAIAHEISSAGGVIRTRTEVTGIAATGGRIHGVMTNSGLVAADAVVVAAGAWSNTLLKPLEVWIPMVPLMATRFITPPAAIPREMPSVLFPEIDDLYVRELDGGLSWGCLYNASPRFDFINGDPPTTPDTRAGALEMRATAEQLKATMPLLHTLPQSEVRTGSPCHTPDYRAVLGRIPRIEGLWVAVGDNYAGVTHAPGFGRLLADLMLGRLPTVSAHPFAPDRFDNGPYTTPAEVLASPLVQSVGWA